MLYDTIYYTVDKAEVQKNQWKIKLEFFSLKYVIILYSS